MPAGLQINSSTGVISGTVAAGDAANGPYSVTVMAGDGTFSATQTFNWNINSPITLTAPADQTNNEGDAVTLAISASGSGTLTYGALGLPAGLAIDPSTGVISGTIALGNSGIGSFAPTIIVGNGTSIASQSFNWYVNGAVNLTSPGDQANTVGDTVTLAIQASYSGSGTLVYAASGLPAGLGIDTSTGVISGTITASAGSYTTTVTAGDGTATATQSFNWTVSAAGVVTMATPSDQSDNEGATVSLTVSATNGGSGSLTYFAAGLPAGLSIDPTTGAITGTVAVGDAAYSPYTVMVAASNGAAGAQEWFTWTVASSSITLATPADQTNNEGDTVSVAISATYSGSGTLTFGATGLPAGLKINTSTGEITGTIALGASGIGQYSVTVTAGDGTYGSSVTFAWTVNSPITLTNPGTQDNMEGDVVSLALNATDASSGTLSFTALGLPPGLKINTSTGAITGSIATGTAANGSYTVTVTAGDNTYSTSQTFTWDIGAIVPPESYTTPENTALTENAADGVLEGAVAPAGTTLTVSEASGPSHGTLTLGSDGSFTYTPTTSWYGTDTFTVYVSDGASNSLTVKETVDVQQNLSQANNDFDAVATGDFNGDGNQDFVAANYDTDSVSVFLGNGDGTFQTPTAYSVGNDPTALAVGDFGNGAEDIAVVNTTDGTVTILMNNGSGSFTTSQTLTVGTDPDSVAAGDFEGNGNQDFAVANKGSNTVSVFTNNGAGSFSLDATLNVGASPTSVISDFLNADSFEDLVVANSGDNDISVLLSNGDGTFATAANYAVGTTPIAVVTGDFSGDGHPDVAVANSGSKTVSILTGNGDGTLQTATNYSVGSDPVALVVANADLIVANHDSNNQMILANSGTGSFSVATIIALRESPDSIAVADFSNNGVLDSVTDAQNVVNPAPIGGLPPGVQQEVDAYRQVADTLLKTSNPKTVADAIANNKRITAFYAGMYTKYPQVPYFALACYASYGVGIGLAKLELANSLAPGLQVFGVPQATVFSILASGNLAIYQDVSWVALAYQLKGMTEVTALKDAIDPVAYQGWVDFDKAVNNPGKALELGMSATKEIVNNEQRVLQTVLDKVAPKLVRQLTPSLNTVKPFFPGFGWGLGDFGDLKYRLERSDDVILPSFLEYEKTDAAAVKNFINLRLQGK